MGMTFLPERFQMHWRGVKQREMSALTMDLSQSLVQPPGWKGHPDLNVTVIADEGIETGHPEFAAADFSRRPDREASGTRGLSTKT
jgi:hypothetical protein